MPRRSLCLVFLAFVCAPTRALPQEDPSNSPPAPPSEDRKEDEQDPSTSTDLPGTVVFGSADALQKVPGSGFYVETDDIRLQSYDDINRILSKVPGVSFRQEDGFGLFPNLSIRGVDTTRSAKVTIMEDGVLMAPAPYSAPEAYFSPTAGRMSAIEVFKGGSQIRYGPHITAGVINYSSTPIPESGSDGYLKVLFGENDEIRIHGYYGTVLETEKSGTIGILVEGYFRETNGFKELDPAMDSRGGESGFTNSEPMLKVRWDLPTDNRNAIEFKYGYTDRDANETYLGLSEADFSADPVRRYSSSRFDQFNSYQNRFALNFVSDISENLTIVATAYHTNFHRNWYKLHDVRNIDTDGDGTPDGVNSSLSAALAGSEGGAALDVLRGARAGDLRIRANNRDYRSGGLQIEPTLYLETENTSHAVRVGARYHSDRVNRFQRNDIFEQDLTGAIADNDGDGIVFEEGTPGDAGDRRQATRAVAVWAEDEITVGRFTINAGLRVERLRQHHDDNNSPENSGNNRMKMLGGGVGVAYEVSENTTAFAGAHRGFSPPGPRAAIKDGLREERVWAYETGMRYRNPDHGVRGEVTGFYSKFEDLIVLDNVGGAGSGDGDSENVGDVDTMGVELFLEYDPSASQDWPLEFPTFLSFTYTNAELANDSTSTDAESIFSGGQDGNDVPYIPEFSATAGTGVRGEKAGAFVTATWVDETYTSASNTSQQVNANGDPDSRFGKTDDYVVVDLSGYLQVTPQTRLLAGVQNLFNDEYVASRHPHGPRPGQPRFAYVGFEVRF